MNELVWRDYTQEQLDANYNQASLVPNVEEYSQRNLEVSAEVRRNQPCITDVVYGPSADERLDIFPASGDGGPVAIYLHGGAWTRTSKSHYSFMAPPFVAAGASMVVLEFSMAPKVSLDEMVRQCRAGIVWTYRNADRYGWNADDIHVIGHSSGAHLCGMTLVTDWEGEYGLPVDLVKSGSCFSGMYDLEPVRLSHRNSYLDLTERAARRNSSIHQIPVPGCPLVIGYGTGELDEFQRQNREFAEAWINAGNRMTQLVLHNANHFEVCNQMPDPDAPILPAILETMGLATVNPRGQAEAS